MKSLILCAGLALALTASLYFTQTGPDAPDETAELSAFDASAPMQLEPIQAEPAAFDASVPAYVQPVAFEHTQDGRYGQPTIARLELTAYEPRPRDELYGGARGFKLKLMGMRYERTAAELYQRIEPEPLGIEPLDVGIDGASLHTAITHDRARDTRACMLC